MKTIIKILTLFFIVSCQSTNNQKEITEIVQWRGENRDGVYNETGLMKEWPDSLSLLWEYNELGNGYASPIITKSAIYIQGEVDSINFLFAFSLNGEKLWETEIGGEWTESFPGARSAPTFYNDTLYVTAGMGMLACIDAKTGDKIWKIDMPKKFGARNTRFGFTESLLVDSLHVYCTPGGIDTNVVALNRRTGEVIWVCKGEGEIPSFTSPRIIKLQNRRLLLTFTKKYLLGIDAETGYMLWSHMQEGPSEALLDVHCNTPLYENGYIYYVTADGNGAVKLKLSEDGSSITEIWRNEAFDDLQGGFIKIGKYIYASSYRKKQWQVLDSDNGTIVDSIKYAQGVTIYADSMLYLYNDKGRLALAKPDGPTISIVSEYRIKKGTKEHFSHPVINNGILYLRRGNTLMAFNIKNNNYV